MKYGYARISTKEQHIDRQVNAMNEIGIEGDALFIDKQSGKDFNRPEYIRLMKKIKEGDAIYILSIDRLGRNYDEIISQWQYITKEVKADIVVMDMPLLDTTVKNSDLTGRFVADLVLQILSYVAQKEREALLQRQRQGISAAKEKGVYQKKDIDMQELKRLKGKVDCNEMTVTAAAEKLGISRLTWYRRIKQL